MSKNTENSSQSFEYGKIDPLPDKVEHSDFQTAYIYTIFQLRFSKHHVEL